MMEKVKMEKVKLNWTVPILFMALPFVYLAPGLIWRSQLLFFILCPVIAVAFAIKNLWVRIFLLYITAWQFTIFIVSFNNPRVNPGPGLEVLLSCMAGGLLYYFVSKGNVPDKTWFSFIRIAVIIQILIAIPQHFKYNFFMIVMSYFVPVAEKLPGHLVGSLGNRNYLAAFIAFSVPMFIGWRTFKIGKWSINPALIAIFIFLGFCLSPGTLAAICGVGFLLSYNLPFWKRLIALSVVSKICVAYAAAYILTTGYHLNEFQALPGQLREFWDTGKFTLNPFLGDVGRFAMWMTAFSQLITKWYTVVLGFGPASAWGRDYPIHGQYFSVWFQFGIIGLGLMLGYIYTTYRFLSKEKHLILLTSFVIICLDMIANFPGQIAPTAFLMVVIGGLIERKRLNG
jgi:hypothetical protein